MSRLLVTSLALALFSSIASAEVKMGLVDFNRMQKSFYKTDLAKTDFEKRRAEETEKLNVKLEELKKLLQLQQGLEKDMTDPALSDEKKRELLKTGQERAGKITSLQKEAMEQQSKTQGELAEEANKIQKDLTTEIYDTTGKVATEKGLDIVFNRTFGINGVPTVAFSSVANIPDITDDVIKVLITGAPAGWKIPADASTPGK